MKHSGLRGLADYTARMSLRSARSNDLPLRQAPLEIRSQLAEEYRERRDRHRHATVAIRAAVMERRFFDAFDLVTLNAVIGRPHFCFLARAFPLMTETERADCLHYVWRHSKSRPRAGAALRLFREATSLRETVPTNWTSAVMVYRGAWKLWKLGDQLGDHRRAWQSAQRSVRHGIAWTTDREVALTFTGKMLGAVGCLGTATVSRDAILAYFQDPNEVEIGGHQFPVHGFREHECIIDPATVKTIKYEAIEKGGA